LTDRLLTAREVAERLSMSTESVLRRWRAREIPGYRLGTNVLRFRESDIEMWLEGCKTDAAQPTGQPDTVRPT
jgi:excisionase family DNA binding protein